MSEPRNQFTFYRSYYEAIDVLSKRDRSDIILAVCAYALYEQEPSGLSAAALAAFRLIKPTLDSSRRKAASGTRGGSKKTEQTPSKSQANRKQTASEIENEIENEIEGEVEEEGNHSDCFEPALRPPTAKEIDLFLSANGLRPIDSQKLIDFYSSRGWMRRGARVTDWRDLAAYWSNTEYANKRTLQPRGARARELDQDELDAIARMMEMDKNISSD